MFVTAHPDDVEGSSGPIVPLLRSQGTQVYYVIFTNGDKGCAAAFCAGWSSEQIAAPRRLEAFAAAAVMNVSADHVFLLDYEDGMLTSYPEQQPREELVTLIRQVQPQVVITWYPYPDFTLQPRIFSDLGYHPDHQMSGKLALDAQFDAGVGLLFPLSGPAWTVSEFYMARFSAPNIYLPVPASAVQTTVDAYLQHKSQYPNATLVEVGLFALAANTAQVVGTSSPFAVAFTAYY